MYRSIQRGNRGSEPEGSGGHDPPSGGLHAVRNRRPRRHHPLLHHRKIVSLTKYQNVPCIPLLDPPMPHGSWPRGKEAIYCEFCAGHKRCSSMAIMFLCLFLPNTLIRYWTWKRDNRNMFDRVVLLFWSQQNIERTKQRFNVVKVPQLWLLGMITLACVQLLAPEVFASLPPASAKGSKFFCIW